MCRLPFGMAQWLLPVLGDVAQLAEHLLCKQGVEGSIPFVSTTPDQVHSSVLRCLGLVGGDGGCAAVEEFVDFGEVDAGERPDGAGGDDVGVLT
jgi:hypothetical protein